MKPYDDRIDYCGPEGLHISKLIPRKVFGVDVNYCCYIHDAGWADGKGHTAADRQFFKDVYKQFRMKAEKERGANRIGFRVAGVLVATVYYLGVRLGRLVLWLKGVR